MTAMTNILCSRSLSDEVFTVSHCGWSPPGSRALYNAIQRRQICSGLFLLELSQISLVLCQLIRHTRISTARERVLRVLAGSWQYARIINNMSITPSSVLSTVPSVITTLKCSQWVNPWLTLGVSKLRRALEWLYRNSSRARGCSR